MWPFKTKTPATNLKNVDWQAAADGVTEMLSAEFTALFGNSQSADSGGSYFTPQYLLGLDTQRMQQKALEICWKSVHARSAVEQKNVLTVNAGLRLQNSPARRILGISSERSGQISIQTEDGFNLYWGQKEVSHDGMDTGPELEAVARASYDMLGEAFVILRYSPKRDRLNPLVVQVISPMSVKSPPQSKLNITEGIEYENNKPIAIHVETFTDRGTVKWERIPFEGKKSKKKFVLHIYKKLTPEQKRGIPMFAPIFHELERIQAALQAEMDTMGTNASVAGVLEREEAVIDPEKLQQLISGVSSNTGAGTAKLPQKTPSENLGNLKKIDTIGGGKIIQNLEKGEKFKEFSTARPNLNIPEFVVKQMQVIGPAIGMASEVWLMLFGKAYAANKGAVDLSWKALEQSIYHFAAGFNQPILEAFADGEVASGRWILPGWSDSKMKFAYMRSKWFGPSKPSLNPKQEAEAAQIRKNEIFSNSELESQQLTGTSFDDNVERRAQEEARKEELGLLMVPDEQPVSGDQTDENSGDDDDDDDNENT